MTLWLFVFEKKNYPIDQMSQGGQDNELAGFRRATNHSGTLETRLHWDSRQEGGGGGEEITHTHMDTSTASMHSRTHTHLFFFITPLFVRRLSGCLLLEGLSLTHGTSWDPLGVCLCVCMCPISKCNRLHSTNATSPIQFNFYLSPLLLLLFPHISWTKVNSQQR